MAKGRILQKGGDLEVQKQNVALSKQIIKKQNVDPLQPRLGEQNVAPLELRFDESNNLCGLELIMVIICNSNDERSLPIQIGNFDRKMMGQIILKFTYIRLNANKKKCTSFFYV